MFIGYTSSGDCLRSCHIGISDYWTFFFFFFDAPIWGGNTILSLPTQARGSRCWTSPFCLLFLLLPLLCFCFSWFFSFLLRLLPLLCFCFCCFFFGVCHFGLWCFSFMVVDYTWRGGVSYEWPPVCQPLVYSAAAPLASVELLLHLLLLPRIKLLAGGFETPRIQIVAKVQDHYTLLGRDCQ